MIRLCIAGVIWVALLWCTLKLCDVSILSSHSVCGVWGCGPPTNALLACHLGWLVFLAPLNPLAIWYCRNHRVDLQIAARILAATCVGAICAIGMHQYLTWLPNAGPSASSCFLQRWTFVIATMTDVPVLQLLLYGMAGSLVKTRS